MHYRHVFLQLDFDKFMTLQEALQPDLYEVLADDDTPRDATHKRLQKSFDRSFTFLDECIKRHAKSENLQKSAILGVVGGGYNEDVRCRFATEAAKRDVQGIVLQVHGQVAITVSSRSRSRSSNLSMCIRQMFHCLLPLVYPVAVGN